MFCFAFGGAALCLLRFSAGSLDDLTCNVIAQVGEELGDTVMSEALASAASSSAQGSVTSVTVSPSAAGSSQGALAESGLFGEGQPGAGIAEKIGSGNAGKTTPFDAATARAEAHASMLRELEKRKAELLAAVREAWASSIQA